MAILLVCKDVRLLLCGTSFKKPCYVCLRSDFVVLGELATGENCLSSCTYCGPCARKNLLEHCSTIPNEGSVSFGSDFNSQSHREQNRQCRPTGPYGSSY